MALLNKPLNSGKGIQRRVRQSGWAPGGGGSQAEAQKRIRRFGGSGQRNSLIEGSEARMLSLCVWN